MNEQQHPNQATNQQQHPDGETSARLLGVLHDLVDDVGPGKTAALLGVDRKTLWRVLKEGRLTPRLVRTVERQARTPAGQNAARRRVRRDALERRVTKPRRDHPELVTLERETGEEFVYGDATPLVVEWREARAAFLGADGSRVERARGWVRMCELELVLVGEHGLTLPPDTYYPWDAFRREEELWRRRRSLRNAHRERRRALRWRFLRRLFTLGLRPR